MYAHICMCLYLCISIHTYIHAYTSRHIYTYIRTDVFVYLLGERKAYRELFSVGCRRAGRAGKVDLASNGRHLTSNRYRFR